MPRDQLRLVALLPPLSLGVYLLDGLLVGGLGGGMTRAIVIAAGIGTAIWGPAAVRSLARIRVRPRALEALQLELAGQTSAQGIAEVLVARVRQLTGARAVTLYVADRLLSATPPSPAGSPSARFALGLPEAPFGEVRCHGALRRTDQVARLLRVGALALRNALLAEEAAAAEHARSQAQAQRDLQRRLTWTVTTQVCTLLAETRERLEIVRLCAGSLPEDVLAQDLDLLAAQLRQLEAFVHDNLRNANDLEMPVAPPPLARLSLPR